MREIKSFKSMTILKFTETCKACTACCAEHFGIKLSSIQFDFDEHMGKII